VVLLVVSERLSNFTESVIREMTILSEEYDAINLSEGMPDFDPPSQLLEAAVEAIRRGPNQYPITWGQRNLREAIAKKAKAFNNIDADPEKGVTVTCGSTEAFTAAVLALTNPGDRIVVTDPLYENYVPDAVIAQAELVYVPFTGRDLTLDEESLKTAMTKHPKLLILNTPNNPTGKVFDKNLLKLIADLCEEEKTIAITDEIYEHIVYDGKQHISLATIGNMHERTVTISGASKTYSVTGWRVGWAIAEAELSDAIRKIHDYLTIGAPTPLQEALVTALNFPTKYYDKLADMYDRKRRIMMKILDEVGLEYYRPEGAYYILVNVPAEFKDGRELADHLLKGARVAVLPASALYRNKQLGNKKIRLAFCKKDVTLQEVGRRFRKVTSKSKQRVAAKVKP
jgi:aspartate/methionine/tyrosine aminotransferase